MGMREKLIELLSESVSKFCKLSVIRGTTKITAISVDADEFADHLIANGVTIPVHCKDCKHWADGVAGCTEHIKCCKIGFYMVGGNGYCVYGERRIDDRETG